MANWDVIVLGLGGVGSATIRHLASRGTRVLGLEQYSPAHSHGSSHGQTRIIRQAYFEHPAYVPLLRRAYQLWEQLERDSQQQLFQRCGLVQMGPDDGVVIPGVLKSAAEYDLSIERLTAREVSGRWPGIACAPDWRAVVETNAGFLRVEQCVEAHLQLADSEGAECRFGVVANDWTIDGSGVTLATSEGLHRASRLVIAGGAWSVGLLRSLEIRLQVLRKHLYWFEPGQRGVAMEDGFPCFFHETPTGYYYGFPAIDPRGAKVARHSGGQPITGPDSTPRTVELDEEDLQLVQEYVVQYLPGIRTRLSDRTGCYYTNTPDEHFIIDRHPQYPQVTVVAGLSGHGFKFTSVLGEIACHLALGELPEQDISLFRLDRPTLRRAARD